MLNPLGNALKRAHGLIKKKKDVHILQSSEISRTDRELLIQTGWLEEIIKGWYMLVRPHMQKGESTAWYISYWDFIKLYLEHLYGKDYCLSAESSIDLHLGSSAIPKQLVVIATGGRGVPVPLLHETSLLVYSDKARIPEEKEEVRGLQVMPLAIALCRITPLFYSQSPKDAEIALRSISQSGELIRAILQNNTKSAAARLIGAYAFLANDKMVKELEEGLAEAGVFVKADNPFLAPKPLLEATGSATANRIFAMWKTYRSDVIAHFPQPPGKSKDIAAFLNHINEIYTQDAYNSLSIEGYAVTKELVRKVAENQWNPDGDVQDQQIRNALAARGYFEAFQEVKQSVKKILENQPPDTVVREDLARWHQKLFAPSARMGILSMADLYGYRRTQVYIRNSRHTPFPKEKLMDAMEAFFQCLCNEEHPGVRAILGHFIFVYIHPYLDGNGRLGRFIMNAMFASGGYPWTIIKVENRNLYFTALEKASLEESIIPFTKFVASQMTNTTQP